MTTSVDAHIEGGGILATESVASTAPPEQQLVTKPAKRERPLSADKLRKRIDALQVKVEKLTAENKALKDQQKRLKSSYSRIHKIPKRNAAQ